MTPSPAVPPRFFAPDLAPSSLEVTLPPTESAHLSRVLRMREDDLVEVFDGRGVLRSGRVRRSTPQGSVILLGDALAASPEAPASIVVAQALLKGDAMDAVIRDATVCGATEVWPMTTARTNVPARAADAAQQRWRRVAVAAAKQCGRAVLPRIAPVRPASDVIALAARADWVGLWLAEPALATDDGADPPRPPRAVCVAVGPEGGWTAEEVATAHAAGWHRWTLAPVTLRAEQMTLAALSVLRYAWDDAVRRRIT